MFSLNFCSRRLSSGTPQLFFLLSSWPARPASLRSSDRGAAPGEATPGAAWESVSRVPWGGSPDAFKAERETQKSHGAEWMSRKIDIL